MQTPILKTLSLVLLGSTVMVPAVAAQDSDQVMSVYERYRPDFSAPGIRSGGFLFYPTVAAEGKFDSNIFADNANEESDYIAIVKPSFSLVSDWNNNYFALNAGADIGRYGDNGGEDYEDFNFGASGRIDISRGTNIFTDLTYADMHEERGSPDDQSQSAPTTYSVLKAVAGFKRDEGVMSFAIDGSYEKNDYDDVGTVGAAGFLENDDRDRETLRSSVRIGFEMNEDYEAFVKFATVKVDYEDSRLDGGPLRDSDGWDVVGGAAFDIGGKSKGEFYIGYVKRDWDSATLASAGNVSDVKFGASLLWSATGLTSVRFAVDRDVVETTTRVDGVNAAGLLSTTYSMRMEHELRRNLLLNGNVSFNKMDFVNTARTDDVLNLGAGAKYLLNRTFSLNADYKYDQRESNEPKSDYDRHSFIVSLSAQW